MSTTETSKILGMLAAGVASCVLFSGTCNALAAETGYRRASDYILHDSYGNAYCSINNRKQTGKFSLQPNYSLGDVDGNGTVNAVDASSILKASSSAGAGAASVESLLAQDAGGVITKNNVIYFADIDQNGKINSVDAACVLCHAAASGSGAVDTPLGFTYYYADANGILQKGFIRDSKTGDTYYAYADYELVTGWNVINGKYYYFDEDAIMSKEGWLSLKEGTYYIQADGSAATGVQYIDGAGYEFDETGKLFSMWLSNEIQPEDDDPSAEPATEAVTEPVTEAVTEPATEPETKAPIQTGWVKENGKTYYIDDNGEKHTGWLNVDGEIYYLDDVSGEPLTGWQNLTSSPDGTGNYYDYYFSPENFTMQFGWLELPEGKYFLDDDGSKHVGVLEYEDNTYKFDQNGLLIVNQETSEGSYDANGIFTRKQKTDYIIPSDVASRELIEKINNADRNPGIRHIDVKNRQYGLPYTTDPDLKKGINLSDRDYQIIEEFAAEHFTEDMTIAERLYTAWWWIHCNVQYAYVQGGYWASIEDKSYVDAIFNYKTGQCVQYNGAMAALLAYYGYDVYMVKGWTRPETNSSQHYWTEVIIDGTRYYVATGNRGKNGDYWQYFFEDAENVNYTATR